MTRKVVVNTLYGEQTIEGMTAGTLKKLLHSTPDDAVVAVMFETTPSLKRDIEQLDVLLLPAWAASGGADLFVLTGQEVENAKYESSQDNVQREVPPVDRSQRTTTNGKPLDQRPETDSPDGQHSNYVVLTEAERAKGFVRPVRDAYRHLECGCITTMSRSLAETYARDPGFYGATYCQHCKGHFPVGEEGEFTWYEHDGSEGPKVGT